MNDLKDKCFFFLPFFTFLSSYYGGLFDSSIFICTSFALQNILTAGFIFSWHKWEMICSIFLSIIQFKQPKYICVLKSLINYWKFKSLKLDDMCQFFCLRFISLRDHIYGPTYYSWSVSNYSKQGIAYCVFFGASYFVFSLKKWPVLSIFDIFQCVHWIGYIW